MSDTAVHYCGKCARKLGREGRVIRKKLEQALEAGRWGKVRLVKADCFSLCPNRGQVLASTRGSGDRRLQVVGPGFVAEEALAYLLGPRT